MEIDARAVSSSEEIKQVMEGLKIGDVDAMLTVPTAPIDNVLQSHILPVVEKLKIPLMTHSRPLTQAGALASYGADFYDLGKQAARLADKVLRGVPAERLPFETPKNYIYTVNKKVLDSMSLQLTDLTKSQVSEYLNESR
jgi:putative ABC transport system substrate-binding protein